METREMKEVVLLLLLKTWGDIGLIHDVAMNFTQESPSPAVQASIWWLHYTLRACRHHQRWKKTSQSSSVVALA